MDDSLVRTKVRIIIEEDGTSNPPILPPATILKRMGTNTGGYYFLTRLDHSVKCLRAKTGEDWTLLNLLIWPSFQGGKLERILSRNGENVVPIGISNVLVLESDSPILDSSKIVYFARGIVKKV